MTATRLLVLGVVRMYGHAHGYQVRRELLSWGAEYWANVQPGSLYHALKKMARDGLLAEVGSEESTEGPGRVVYELTEEGETEFMALMGKALSRADRDLSLTYAATSFLTTLTRQHAIGLLRYRISALDGTLTNARQSVEFNSDMGKPEHVAELFRHWQYSAEAMRRWTSELIERLEAGEYVMADDAPDYFGAPRTPSR